MIEALWGTGSVSAIQEFFGPGWSWLFHMVTLLGAHEVVALVVAVTLWLSGRWLAYAILGIVVLVMIVDFLLWQTIGLPRPSGPEIVVRGTTPASSFPSGHTVVATATWSLLALFGRVPKALVPPIVGAVMLSRLYLGMHYLGDVIGGALIGLLLVAIFVRLWPPLARRLSCWPFWIYMALGFSMPLAILPLSLVMNSPRVWVAFGAALGAGIGLPLEYRYVRYAPAGAAPWRQALKILIGLGVIGGLLGVRDVLGLDTLAWDAALFGLAAFWLAFGAPAVFRRLGFSACLVVLSLGR